MKFKPAGPNILIQVDAPKTVTEGGLHLPNVAASQQPTTAKVIAIGTGRYTDAGAPIPFGVSPGDKIYFNQFAGHEIELDGELYRVICIDDVFGVIR